MAEPLPDSRCERCGGAFHCGANDPEPCACTRIALDATTLARLRQAYTGCLCLRCLAERATQGAATSAIDRGGCGGV